MKEIIIIDDDNINNYICEYMIKSAVPETQVRCFSNCMDALSQLSESEIGADTAILLDLNMPVMDGWEFLEKFKEKEIKCDLFIVTTSINPHDREVADNSPLIKSFISKPLTDESVKLIIGK